MIRTCRLDRGRHLESCFFGGSSALLVAIIEVVRGGAVVYPFAFAPILVWSSCSTLLRTLEASFFMAASLILLTCPPGHGLLGGFMSFQAVAIVATIPSLGAAANLVSRRLGCDILVTAMLWVPVEIVLARFLLMEWPILGGSEGFFYAVRFGSLFVVVLVITLALLVNAFILVAALSLASVFLDRFRIVEGEPRSFRFLRVVHPFVCCLNVKDIGARAPPPGIAVVCWNRFLILRNRTLLASFVEA